MTKDKTDASSYRSEIHATNNFYSNSTYSETYNDHRRDHKSVVLIHKWSLYAGCTSIHVYTVKCGLYTQVVFI